MVLLHSWLLLLTLLTLGMSVACLKYCATNRDAKWSLVSVIALVTVWATWLALVRLLEYKYRWVEQTIYIETYRTKGMLLLESMEKDFIYSKEFLIETQCV